MPFYTQYLPNNRRSEIELLVCCARNFLDQEHTELIQNIAQKDIDWDYLIQVSYRHRVLPLLYRNLKNARLNGVTDQIIKKLKNFYLSNAIRNFYLTSELLKVLELIEGQNIFAVPFKGPILAESLYGGIALRQFYDLDILVRVQDIIKVRSLLLANGYRDRIDLDDQQFIKFARTNTQDAFIRHDGIVNIELHWEMSNKYISMDYDFQQLRGRFETVTLQGKKVRNLIADDLLFYLCIHGTRHLWENLEMICCVAELIRSHPQIDWNWVNFLATNMRCERILFLGLFLAHDLYGTNLPSQIAKKIADDSMISRIATEIYQELFREDEISYEMSTKFHKLFFHIKVRNRLSEKIRFCLDELIRPKEMDWIVCHLPASLSFLHYVIRPVRLVFKWIIEISKMQKNKYNNLCNLRGQ